MNSCSKNTHNVLSSKDRVIVVHVVQFVVDSSVGSDWGFLLVFTSQSVVQSGFNIKRRNTQKRKEKIKKKKKHCRQTALDFIVIIISLLVFAPVDHAILTYNWVRNDHRAGVGTFILQNIKFSLSLMQFYSWLTFIEIS